MAFQIASLTAVLKADTSDLDRGLKQAQSGLEQTASKARESGGILQGALSVAIGSLVAGAVPAIGSLASQAVSLGSEFSGTVNKIQAVAGVGSTAMVSFGGQSVNAMEAVRQQALKLGQDLPLSAQQGAEGILELVAGGFALEDALAASTGVAQLAAAHVMNVGDSAAIVSSVLNGFGDSLAFVGDRAAQAGYAADVLSQIANSSAAGIADIGETMKYVGGVAGGLSQPLSDVGAAIGLMANSGIVGSMAGTSLRAVLTELAAPGDAAAATLKQLGITTTDASGKMLPFMAIADQFRNAMQGMTDAQRTQIAQTIAGTPGMAGFLSILNAAPAQFDSIRSAMDTATGATDRFAQATNQGFGFQFEQLKGSIETVLVQGFLAVEPALAQVAASATGLVNSIGAGLTSITPQIKAVVSNIQSIGQAFASGGAGAGTAALLSSLGLDPGAASQVGAVVDGIVGAVQSGAGRVQSAVDAFRSGIASGSPGAATAGFLASLGIDESLAGQVGSTVASVVTGIGTAKARLSTAIDGFKSGWSAGAGVATINFLTALGVSDELAGQIGGGVAGIVTAINTAKSRVQTAIDGFKSGWASGGAGVAVTNFLSGLGLSDQLASAVGGKVGEIVTSLSTAKGKLATAIDGFRAGLPAGAGVATINFLTALGVGEDQAAKIGVGVGAVAQAIQDAKNKLGPAIDSFKSGLAAGPGVATINFLTAMGISEDAAGKVGTIVAQVAGVLQNIPNILQGAFQRIQPLVEQLGAGFQRFLAALAPALPNVQYLAQVVGVLLYGAFVTLVGFVSGALPGLANIITGAVNIIAGVFKVLQGVIMTVGSVVMGLVTGDWARAWELAKSGVATIFSGIGDIIKGALGIIVGAVRAIVGGVIGVFQSLYDQLVGHSIIPDMVNDIVDWFTRLPGMAADAIRGGISAITSAAQQIVTDVMAVLNTLVTQAADAGRGLVDAFKNGLVSKIQEIKDAVGQMAQAARNLLPGSDAKEGPLSDLTASGRALGTTFAAGVAAGGGAATNAVSQMAADTLSSLLAILPQIAAAMGALEGKTKNIDMGRMADSIDSLRSSLVSLLGVFEAFDKLKGADTSKNMAHNIRDLVLAMKYIIDASGPARGGMSSDISSPFQHFASSAESLLSSLNSLSGLLKLTDDVAKSIKASSLVGIREFLVWFTGVAVTLVSDAARATVGVQNLNTAGLVPLNDALGPVTSIVNQTNGLLKGLSEAMTFDLADFSFDDANNVLFTLISGVMVITRGLQRLDIQVGDLQATLGPLAARAQSATGVVNAAMGLLKAVADALTFDLDSINLTRANQRIIELISTLAVLTRGLGRFEIGVGDLSTTLQGLITRSQTALGIVDGAMALFKSLAEALAFDFDTLDLTRANQQIMTLISVLASITRGLGNFVTGTDDFSATLGPLVARSQTTLNLLKTGFDLIEALTKPPALPPITDTLRDYLRDLVLWLEDVAGEVGGALTVFGVTYPLLDKLLTEAQRAAGVISTGLDMVESLTKPPRLPNLDEGGLRAWLNRLPIWMGEVTIAVGAGLTAFGVSYPLLERLGTEADRAAGVIGVGLDMIEKLTKPPAFPELSTGGLRAWLYRLPLWIGEVTIAVGATLTAFGVSYPLLERLNDEASRAAGVIGVGLDLAEKLTKPPALPDLNAGGLRQWLQRLPIWLGEVTIAVGATLTAFGVTYPLLDRLGTEAGRAAGVVGTALDLAEKLVKPPALPDLGFGAGSIRAWLNRLPIWLGEVTIAVGASLTAFGVTYPLLDRLGTEADRASGVVGTGLDMVDKLNKPPRLPNLDTGGLRAWLQRLPTWLGEVTIAVGATLTAFGVSYPLLERLKTEADRALGVISVGLDAVERLTKPPALPPLGSGPGSLRQFVSDLTVWIREIATEVGRQAATSGISEAWEQAAATLSSTFGSAADSIMKYIDLVQKLSTDLPLTVPGGPNPFGSWWGGSSPNPMLDPAQVKERVKPIIEGIKEIARQMGQAAADLQAEGVDVGAAGGLGSSLSNMVSGVVSMVDGLAKLGEVKVDGRGLQNLRDLLFQVFGIVAGAAGQAAQVQTVASAISAALGGMATLASSQGYTAGSNWVDSFVDAIADGAGDIQAAIVSALSGGASAPGPAASAGGSGAGAGTPNGGGGGRITAQTYVGEGGTNIESQKNFYIYQTATESRLRTSAGSILALDALHGA